MPENSIARPRIKKKTQSGEKKKGTDQVGQAHEELRCQRDMLRGVVRREARKKDDLLSGSGEKSRQRVEGLRRKVS